MASSLRLSRCVGVKRLEELAAYQLAVQFKRGVYGLVRARPEAYRDYRWRAQLFEAARGGESNIAEGWRRFQKRQICQFFRYALASLEEARRCLLDGVDRGYFKHEDCEPLIVLARRCGAATLAFMKSLENQ